MSTPEPVHLKRNGRKLLPTALLSIDTLIVVGLLVGGAYLFIAVETSRRQVAELRSALSETVVAVQNYSSTTQQTLTGLEDRVVALSDTLYNEQKNIEELADNVEGFDRTVGRLSGSVETLEKLTTIDEELLQKYSKIYFLNEHYMPEDLEEIDERYEHAQAVKDVTVHAEVHPFLEDLLKAAWDDGINLKVLSGYRSFEDQNILKQHYTVQYGTGANTFSADQGYSEHQLGTTVDFTTTELGNNIEDIDGTKAFEWLEDNAYKYGFVMSYPKDNIYYQYEPWHWRFVGKDLARYLDRKNKSFYDLEQREIDEYITTLFDK